MTIVVGFNWSSEVVMVADTRVTWLTDQKIIKKTEDALQKLYAIQSQKKSAVLGFSGDIEAAKKIIMYLREHKLSKFFIYDRPLIMAKLKDDLHRWIDEAVQLYPEVWPRCGEKLNFMLCGIEPSRHVLLRHPPRVKDGKIIFQSPSVEYHIYNYLITDKGEVSVNTKPVDFAIIGTGKELEKEIRRASKEVFDFAYGVPQLQWGRSVVLGDCISHIIGQNEKVSTTVGGLYQVVRITPDGLKIEYALPPGVAPKNTEAQRQGEIIVISNPSLEKRYFLHPIWAFPF